MDEEMVITSVSIVCEEKNVGEKFTLIQYNSFDVHRIWIWRLSYIHTGPHHSKTLIWPFLGSIYTTVERMFKG